MIFPAVFLIVPAFPRQPWRTGAGEESAWHSGGSHTPLLSRPGLCLIFYHPKATISSEESIKFKTICHLGSFRKVKTCQRPNSHVWHQKGSCPICSFNIITAQPMTLKALTACLGQGHTLVESQDFTGAPRKIWVQHRAKVLGAGQDLTHVNLLLVGLVLLSSDFSLQRPLAQVCLLLTGPESHLQH